jgi:hypothetical protein
MQISWRRILAVVIGALLVSGVGYASARAYRIHNVRSHFDQVHEGQSQQEVRKLLGSPSEDIDCYCPSASEDYRRRCVERFWYYGFMEQWGVDFDVNGKVIGSFYNVSP